MRLDFHTHGKLAKKLPFSTAYTDWLFGEARQAGLDALCLTEHFNTLQFADVYGYIASVSRRIGDTLELENGITAESVKWSTSDSSIATVYNGNVTAIGKGTCVIRAEYDGQVAECVVRCKF